VATRQTKNKKETYKVKNPNPMLQLILQHHITLLHRDASSWGNDRIGSSDLLDSGGWVPRSLQVHHQWCTVGQRIPGITMTACADIFTKAVTSNPQSTQPKCLNQICDSHPDLTEQTTIVHLIPPLTINTDTRKQTRSTETQINHFQWES